MKRKPNLIFFGIDSLRRDHMSLYGYRHRTTPYIDAFADGATVFENPFSPSIPTTPAYASMLTGMDAFTTDIVALRHRGPMGDHVTSLPEILQEHGYGTTCVGFTGNPSSRGFQRYLDFHAWGSYEEGRLSKADNLNQVAIPAMKEHVAEGSPFFLFLRHMDPHAPYLPPSPYERLFYGGDEKDPHNRSMEPVFAFKPFADFLRSWLPSGVTDKDYVIAQYDGEVAYMDACIQNLLNEMQALGIEEDTLVVLTSDHGETLYDHGCFFDHHGLYDCTLTVPLVFRYPGRVPEGKRVPDICQLKDVAPTILDLLDIDPGITFDGRSLVPLMHDGERAPEPEIYITECTWMRKHGWRTPEWKLIHALEPDFHFKPEVELYNLIADPAEKRNVADEEPEVVRFLEARMQEHIQRREKATGRTNPMYTNLHWAKEDMGPFESSQQAYDSLYIGSAAEARRLQAKNAEEEQPDDESGA